MTRPPRDRRAYHAAYRKANPGKRRAYDKTRKKPEPTVVGIDGEGLTVDGRHIYRYLAAWSETDCISTLENEAGITPDEAFTFLLGLKDHCPDSLLVGFALNYDISKWIQQLPDWVIYKLMRPEVRHGKKHPLPVKYGGWALNYLRGRFTVSRLIEGKHIKHCSRSDCKGCVSGESVSVWDVWGFFQGSFVDACEKWKVITKKEYAALKKMKAERSTFSEDQWEAVKEYCGQECRKLASLVSAMRGAHIEAGLPLRSYYGAGSTASVLLRKMRVKEYMPPELPVRLQHAIASAFFGGRFELSRIGSVNRPVWSYDIASAYPYQLWQLPCLACGKWELHTQSSKLQGLIESASAALVRYELPYCDAIPVDVERSTSEHRWGPFPLRTKGIGNAGPLDSKIDDGNILYPVTSGGGWVYDQEFLTAQKYWPNVVAKSAWIYRTECDHRPFADLASVYCERLRWGKNGPGIVLKLGPNSCYGKLAQSVGQKPPFQCFGWAGMVTSGCRSQLLELVGQDPEGVLMTATDGVVCENELNLPLPLNTDTASFAASKGKEALGAWESKHIPGGIHMIRPGIAFPLRLVDKKKGDKTDEKETKARGIGKVLLKNHRQRVLNSWEKHGTKSLVLESSMFHGAKSSTSLTVRGYQRSLNYGQWRKRVQSVSYMPEPKRPFLTADGLLHTWAFGPDVVSAPYSRAMVPDLVKALKQQQQLESEQPDGHEPDEEF